MSNDVIIGLPSCKRDLGQTTNEEFVYYVQRSHDLGHLVNCFHFSNKPFPFLFSTRVRARIHLSPDKPDGGRGEVRSLYLRCETSRRSQGA